MTADRIGKAATEFIDTPDGRVPKLTDEDKALMAADLYRCGWAYWLIAQAMDWTGEQTRTVLTMPQPRV